MKPTPAKKGNGFPEQRGPAANSPSAFTLVELLVTIGIIAILAALLLGVLSSAKLKVQQTHCTNNLRQMGTIGLMYASENAGNHPPHDDPRFPGGSAWMGTLNITAQKQSIVVCPVAPLRDPVPDAGNGQGTADKAWVHWTSDERTRFFGSYGFNSWFYTEPANRPPGTWPHSFNGNIPRPSTSPVFADENWVDAPPWENEPPFHDLYAGSPLTMRSDGIGRFTISRHGGLRAASAPRQLASRSKLPGAIIISYADGHTKPTPLEQLWALDWHLDWQTPAVRPQDPR